MTTIKSLIESREEGELAGRIAKLQRDILAYLDNEIAKLK